MPPAVALSSGTILDGRYRVDEPVGEGGFATVYAGFHLTLGVRVAIKALHLDDPDLVIDFIEEAKLVTRLRHDNIVRTLDQGIARSEDGRSIPYLVLEWCGDETLAQRVQREGALPLAEAQAIVRGVAAAMAHAHEAHIIHRDLKPSNVMLARTAGGAIVPRVIDFGVGKVFEPRETTGHTATGSSGKFTPAYAAPEQVAGTRTGPYTDVHAIGLIFHELVTGRAPFAADTQDRRALGNVDPERPSPARLGVDVGSFEAVIAKAVALRPADRFPDARALLAALEAVGRDADHESVPPRASFSGTVRSPETSPPTSHTATTTTKSSGRSPALVVAVSVLASALAVYAIRARTRLAADDAPVHATEPASTSASAAPIVIEKASPTSSSSTSAWTSTSASSSAAGLASGSAVKKVVAAPPRSVEKPQQGESAHVSSAPAVGSINKGVGGIVETPPF